MAYAGSERRKDPRLSIKFPVKFKIKNGKTDMHVFQASGKDISAGGICMEMALLHEEAVEKVYKSKGFLEIEIDIPDTGKSISTEGEIVWMRKDQDKDMLGIFFRNISQEEKDLLAKYVSDRLE